MARFVAIEGSEGVGKSTQITHLIQWLQDKQIDVVQTREPGGSPAAEAIRAIAIDPTYKSMPDKAEVLLMFAARADHVENTIRPALARGAWVVSDRFTEASYAYQGAGRQIGSETIEWLEKFVLDDFRPDLTIVLTLDRQVADGRVTARGQKDRIEVAGEDFYRRVEQAYLDRAALNAERTVIIDASGTPEAVHQRIIAAVEEYLF